ncbi:MAG: ABC transporter ATP-binding protein [Candidatus Binatia bacterium]
MTDLSSLPEQDNTLVSVKNVVRHFRKQRGFLFSSHQIVRAVDGVSFDMRMGETLGLVGESGCGKSTVGRLVLGIDQPSSGDVRFQGRDIGRLPIEERRTLCREMQMIFQDPLGALDPRMDVQSQIREPLDIHGIGLTQERAKQVDQMLEAVSLPRETKTRYPHELSGGQQQRVVVARALILRPKLIVCDEPVSALDVSIQAQVLNLLADLRNKFRLTYLFISHDLKVVRHISNRVAVMYLGKIVEIGERKTILDNPLHPYTQALISAIPVPDPSFKHQRILLQGEPPSPVNPPAGCRFHTRCPHAQMGCREQEPDLKPAGPSRYVACHLVDGTIRDRPPASERASASTEREKRQG